MSKKSVGTLINQLKGDFKNVILGNIILQILFLIFGVIIYMNPLIAAKTVGIIIGIYFFVFGIFGIGEFFLRKNAPIFGYKIFNGILTIIIGILIMLNPFKIIKILTFALGIYLIIVSIFKVLEAFKLKKYGYDGWLVVLITSIILAIFGVFVAINPLASMDIIEVTGIFIILSSILEICNLFMIYSRAKEIGKLFKEVK